MSSNRTSTGMRGVTKIWLTATIIFSTMMVLALVSVYRFNLAEKERHVREVASSIEYPGATGWDIRDVGTITIGYQYDFTSHTSDKVDDVLDYYVSTLGKTDWKLAREPFVTRTSAGADNQMFVLGRKIQQEPSLFECLNFSVMQSRDVGSDIKVRLTHVDPCGYLPRR